MILSAEELMEILGMDRSKIDVVGLKLTLYKVYRYANSGIITASSKHLPQYKEVPPINGRLYFLKPGAYTVRYSEYIRIPDTCIALALPRSSLLRMGATLHTAVWDPGYEGQGIGLLVVHNPHGIYIEKGAQIAQLIYIRLSRRTRILYEGVYKGEKDQ